MEAGEGLSYCWEGEGEDGTAVRRKHGYERERMLAKEGREWLWMQECKEAQWPEGLT